jgi:transcription initiation factor TFIIE subunit alpha
MKKSVKRKAVGKKAKVVAKIKASAKTTAKKAVLKKTKAAVPEAKKAKVSPPEAPRPTRMSPEQEQALMKRIVTILSDCRVRQNLIGIGGENALAIVRNFTGNQSDEDLAKRLKIKISDVRATLNKLHNEGLVNYIREKDSETGWYSYSWSLNHDRMERWADTHAGKLSALGADAGSEFYFCPSCGAESVTNFESAAGCEFRCERCNKMMEFIDEKGLADLFDKKK